MLPRNSKRAAHLEARLQEDDITSEATTHARRKSGLSYNMEEVCSAVCWRDGECPARQDEWTPLRHQDEEDGKASCGPLLPTRPHRGRSGNDGDREDSQEQQTVEKGKRKLLDLYPQNAVSTLTQSG